jgi:hypothetical protein
MTGRPLGERAMTDAERQRKRRERLRAERPAPPDPRQMLAEAQEENERLRQQVRELMRHPIAKPPQSKPAKPKVAVDEPAEVARLKKIIRELRAELRFVRDFHEAEQGRKGIMSFTTYSAVMKCLHPDQAAPTVAQRTEACSLFSQWRRGNGKASPTPATRP